MATPMTHTEFTDLLRKWGIPYKVNDRNGVDWYEHNRAGHGAWGPVNGIGNHHTGGKDNADGASVLWNGYGALPGPLCHAGIRTDGSLLLNGWGRVNHFGLGDSDVLQHVVNEDYTGQLHPRKANVDGNVHFYGFEWMYDGLSEPSEHYPKLYRTAVRLNAAICTHHGWTELSSIGHGEWQPGKWDPGHANGKLFDCAKFRGHVKQAIAEGPNPKPPTPPTHTPSKPIPGWQVITVAKGDTFYSLARKYYDSPEAGILNIIEDNPQLLQPGMKLQIPKK